MTSPDDRAALTDSYFIEMANNALPWLVRKDDDFAYITFARALLASQPQPVNRADDDAVQQAMIRTLRDDCERESKKTDCYTCYTEQPAYMVKRLNTILLAPPIGSWDKGRADGDAVPVHDHPSTEAGDYLPIDFGDAVPVAWVKPFALESLKQQDKVGTRLYRMKHKNAHATVPLYSAPPASTDAVPVAYMWPGQIDSALAFTWTLSEFSTVPVYLAAPLASTSADAQRYTQADMEAYGKAYADARDKRLAQTSAGAQAPVAFYDGSSNEPCLMWAYDGYKPRENEVVLIAAPIASALPAQDLAPKGWVIARETASDVGTDRKELTYALFPGLPPYATAEIAMDEIKAAGLPIGWVAISLEQLFSASALPAAQPGEPE